MNNFRRTLLVGLFIIVAFLFGLLVIFRDISSEAVSAFIGVLVGSAITGTFQYLISEEEQRLELRIVAINKRLDAHQKAYTLWFRLLFTVQHGDENYTMVMKCQDWWEENCLFLSPEARKAFQDAYIAAKDLAISIAAHDMNTELLKSTTKVVKRAGKIIEESANLPSIGELISKKR